MVKPIKTYVSAPLFSVLVFSILSIISSHAIAIECYTPSPNLTSLGDEYYGLDTPVLSNEIQNKLNGLFRAMVGQWKGHMQQHECSGPDNAPRTISRSASVTATARLSSMVGLEVNAEKHDIENRIKSLEQLSLIGSAPTFNLKFVSDNRVVFSERYRKLNQVVKKEKTANQTTEPVKLKTSRITETIYEIEANGGSIDLARRYYINSVYIGEERWQMQRD